MKGQGKLTALIGIGIIAIIIFTASVIAFIADPASFLALETQAGQEAYRLTGGLVGIKPPPPPPVSFIVGEEVLFNGNTTYYLGDGNYATGSLGIGWSNQQPMGSSVFTWYGSCKVPTELYALNITNEANVPIVKIVIYLPGGFGTNAPLPSPWYTNSTFYSPSSEGNVTDWEIANVNIPPHTTVVVWNASSLAPTVPIWFYFSNGSVYKTQIPWTPNYPL
jgi:hypothetical protein